MINVKNRMATTFYAVLNEKFQFANNIDKPVFLSLIKERKEKNVNNYPRPSGNLRPGKGLGTTSPKIQLEGHFKYHSGRNIFARLF